MENLNIGERVSVVTTPFMPIGAMTKKPAIEEVALEPVSVESMNFGNSREAILERIRFGEFQELYPLLLQVGILSEREKLSITKAWLKEDAPEHVRYYAESLLFGNYHDILITDIRRLKQEERENGRK